MDIQELKRAWMNRDADCMQSLFNTTPYGCNPSIEQQLFFTSERVKDLVRLVFILADEIDALKRQIAKPQSRETSKPSASD